MIDELKPRMTREEALVALSSMTEADFLTVPADEDDIDDAFVERVIEAGRRAAGRPSLTAPGRHSPQITIRLPESVNARVVDLASRTGRRRSQVVRDALDAYLVAGETKRPKREGIFRGGEPLAEHVDEYLVGFGE